MNKRVRKSFRQANIGTEELFDTFIFDPPFATSTIPFKKVNGNGKDQKLKWRHESFSNSEKWLKWVKHKMGLVNKHASPNASMFMFEKDRNLIKMMQDGFLEGWNFVQQITIRYVDATRGRNRFAHCYNTLPPETETIWWMCRSMEPAHVTHSDDMLKSVYDQPMKHPGSRIPSFPGMKCQDFWDRFFRTFTGPNTRVANCFGGSGSVEKSHSGMYGSDNHTLTTFEKYADRRKWIERCSDCGDSQLKWIGYDYDSREPMLCKMMRDSWLGKYMSHSWATSSYFKLREILKLKREDMASKLHRRLSLLGNDSMAIGISRLRKISRIVSGMDSNCHDTAERIAGLLMSGVCKNSFDEIVCSLNVNT